MYDNHGHIWSTEPSGNRIGRLNIAIGLLEEFLIPTPNSGLYGIIAGAEDKEPLKSSTSSWCK